MKIFGSRQRRNREAFERVKPHKIKDELISNPARIYKDIHKALGIKERSSKSLGREIDESMTVWDMVTSANRKLDSMRETLAVFFEDYEQEKVFKEPELETLKQAVESEVELSDKLHIFAQAIRNRLSEYFDITALPKSKSCPFTSSLSADEKESRDFFGGMTNQLSTTISLTAVALRLMKKNIKDGLLEFQSNDEFQKSLMSVMRNLKPTLYGFAKTQMLALLKLFNVLGHVSKIPPAKFQYQFKESYFDFDDKQSPTKLLPKKKLIADLKLWSRLFPFVRNGMKLKFFQRGVPAFGCPAFAIKAPNGDDFIKLIHDFICDSFEKTVLPSLDQMIRV